MKKLALLLAMLMLAGSACAEEFFAEEEPAAAQESAFSEDFFAEDGADGAVTEEPEEASEAEGRSVFATFGDDVSDAGEDQCWAAVKPSLTYHQTTAVKKGAASLVLGSATFEWGIPADYDEIDALLKKDKKSSIALHLYRVDINTGIARDVKTIPFSKKMKADDGTLGGTFTLTKLATDDYIWFVRLEKSTKKAKGRAEAYGASSPFTIDDRTSILGSKWDKTVSLTIERKAADQAEVLPLYVIRWVSDCNIILSGSLTMSMIYADGSHTDYDITNLSSEEMNDFLDYDCHWESNGLLYVQFRAPEYFSKLTVTATPSFTPGDESVPAMTGKTVTASWTPDSDNWKDVTLDVSASSDNWADLTIGNTRTNTLPDRLVITGMKKNVTLDLTAVYDGESHEYTVTCPQALKAPFTGFSCEISHYGEMITGYSIKLEGSFSPGTKAVTVTPQKKNGKKYTSGNKSSAFFHDWLHSLTIDSVKQTGNKTAALTFSSPLFVDSMSVEVAGFSKTLVLSYDSNAQTLVFAKDYGADYTLSGNNTSGYTVSGPVKKTGKITFTVTPREAYTVNKKVRTVKGTAVKKSLTVTAARTAACLNIVPGYIDEEGNLDVTFRCFRADADSFRVTLVEWIPTDDGRDHTEVGDDRFGSTFDSYDFAHVATVTRETTDQTEFTASFKDLLIGECTIFVETFLTDGSRVIDSVNSTLERARIWEPAPDMSFLEEDITAEKLTDESGEFLGYLLNDQRLTVDKYSQILSEDQEWQCTVGPIESDGALSGIRVGGSGAIPFSFRYKPMKYYYSAWSDPVTLTCYQPLSVRYEVYNSGNGKDILRVYAQGGIEEKGYTYSVTITQFETDEPYYKDENKTEFELPVDADIKVSITVTNNDVYCGGSPLTASLSNDN